MPVVRIGDEVWRRLKAFAEPLDDSVEDALRKALDMADDHKRRHSRTDSQPSKIGVTERDKTKRLPKGTRLPEEAYERPILQALYSLGGSARTREVLDIVESKMTHLFSDADREPLPKSGETRWRNTAQWERKRLVEDGLLRGDSPHGIWELPEEGVRVVENEST